MKSLVLAVRDVVIAGIASGSIVGFVLGYPLVGVLLGLVAVWQLARTVRGRASIIGIDQRYADQEGKPNIS